MNSRHLCILVYLSVILNTTCEKPQIELTEDDAVPQLAVVAYLMDGLQPLVFVSSMRSFAGDSVVFAVREARIDIYKDNNLLTTLKYNPYYGNNYGGNDAFRESMYLGDSVVNLMYGSTYQLRISAPRHQSAESELVVAEQKLGLTRFDVSFRSEEFIDNWGLDTRISVDTIAVTYNCTADQTHMIRLEAFQDGRVQTGQDSMGASSPYDPIEGDLDLELACGINSVQTFTPPYGAYPLRIISRRNSFLDIELVRYPPIFREFMEGRSGYSTDLAGLSAVAPTATPTNMVGGHGIFVVAERYAARHAFE